MIKRSNIKRTNIVNLLLGLLIILLVNVIASFLYTRFDLTAEKRYSLSPATKQLIKKVDDVIFFKVYLDGDLPPGFRRLSNETREMLDEFRAYNDNIQFEFTNPSDIANAKERNEAYQLLVEQGLQPTNLRVNKKGEASQMIIFPGCIVSFRGRDVPVQLLMTQMGENPDKVLNNSIQGLEYNLASAIQKLTTHIKPSVAIIEGQGELSQAEMIDFEAALGEYYIVERVTIGEKINSLTMRLQSDSVTDKLVNKYRAIIIAKPTLPFSDKDKFLIDQFIMRGGKSLWLVDPVFASMDSLEKYTSTIGIVNDVKIDEMLFNFGVRLNNNLVMDLSALPIPIMTGSMGGQPQFEYFPWFYFPILTPTMNHPIVSGLDAIKTEFISTIDTVEKQGISKTFLLTSSPYSRTVNVPALIDLEILRKEPDKRLYQQGPQPVAVLLEGAFTSAYQHRIPPEIAENEDLGFRETGKPTKMVIIADGDIAKNQFHFKEGYPLPLGYDQYTRRTFGNKNLLLNVVNFLCDDSGLITVRSRELKLRLLDQARVTDHRLSWQLLNILAPVVLILLFGIVKYRIRLARYAKKR